MDDWDGVELGPEVVELSLVPAKGKYGTVHCYTHNTHGYSVLTDRCD